MQEQLARIEVKLDNVVEKVERIDAAIYGNGADGLKIQVDRNTQGRTTFRKLLWIIVTAVIGIAVMTVL